MSFKGKKHQSYFEKASTLVAAFSHSEGNVVFVVWYKKQPTFNEDDTPQSKTQLIKDYVRLAQVKAANLGEVFEIMQGEMWSPYGQANEVIRGLGLSHTSMSVGDLIQSPNGKFWAVMDMGFKELQL